MVSLKQLFSSSLGRKYLMGASGLALVIFIILHLLGNLTLYAGHGEPMNTYSARLHSLGMGLIIAEVGLLLTFVIHIIAAIQVTMTSKNARPIGYASTETKGGPTKNTMTSRNMIVTGLVLLLFLIVHLKQMRFGPNVADGYTASLEGVMVHDIYRVVVETFQDIKWVIFYSASMFFLGFHFRHGFWSAFQSLGAINPRWSKPIYAMGLIIALLLTAGFFFMPIYIYATQGGAS
ncbi:MAG: succinate dehydrogenase cytochrome b subunit [Bdellovibrionales bacterium]|nr:succinate dehydrogenase cytochrome b subunit [Bdellovibrionales bacterium]